MIYQICRVSEEEFDAQARDLDIMGVPFIATPSGRLYPRPLPWVTVFAKCDPPFCLIPLDDARHSVT